MHMSTTDKMERNLQKYRSRVEEIRRDWTRSEGAKRPDLEAAYTEARSTHDKLAEEYRTGIQDNLKKTRKAAFSAPTILGSDKAMQLMAYRDALDRAARTTDTRTLSDMLARAEMVGDAPLAKGVLYRGYELQNEDLIQSYFEKYPDELPAWDEFMEAAEESNKLETLGISLAAGVSEPEQPREL